MHIIHPFKSVLNWIIWIYIIFIHVFTNHCSCSTNEYYVTKYYFITYSIILLLRYFDWPFEYRQHEAALSYFSTLESKKDIMRTVYHLYISIIICCFFPWNLTSCFIFTTCVNCISSVHIHHFMLFFLGFSCFIFLSLRMFYVILCHDDLNIEAKGLRSVN